MLTAAPKLHMPSSEEQKMSRLISGPMASERLIAALVQLEAAVGTPLVPGELSNWSLAVDSALRSVQGCFADAVAQDHEPILQTIVADDWGLLPRVQQLRRTDSELRDGLQRALGDLGNIRWSALRRSGAPVAEQLAPWIDSVQRLIVRIRQQEESLRTWLVEAEHRDRGFSGS